MLLAFKGRWKEVRSLMYVCMNATTSCNGFRSSHMFTFVCYLRLVAILCGVLLLRRIPYWSFVAVMGNALSKFVISKECEQKQRLRHVLVTRKKCVDWSWVLKRPNRVLRALGKACYRIRWAYHADVLDYNLGGFLETLAARVLFDLLMKGCEAFVFRKRPGSQDAAKPCQ